MSNGFIYQSENFIYSGVCRAFGEVVPPELAYGDAGYPPKVPPGATMVYTIRVENVRGEKISPEEQKQEKTVE